MMGGSSLVLVCMSSTCEARTSRASVGITCTYVHVSIKLSEVNGVDYFLKRKRAVLSTKVLGVQGGLSNHSPFLRSTNTAGCHQAPKEELESEV